MKSKYNDYYKNAAPLFDQVRLDKDLEIENTVNIIKTFLTKPSGSILDVGCGTGRYAKFFRQINYNTVGIDISLDQLECTPRDSKRICASSDEIPLKENCFDAALFSLVLQQLDKNVRIAAFKEIHRILVKDGKVFIRTCSHKDLLNRPFNDIFPSSLSINLRRYPRIQIIANELRSIGFAIVDNISTYTEQEISTEKLLYSMKKKHNTTLSLLPPDEFEAGYNALKNNIKGLERYSIPHYHSIVVASK